MGYRSSIQTSQIKSGTFDDARISSSSVTQHDADLEGVLNPNNMTVDGNIDAASNKIVNLAAPENANDAARKADVTAEATARAAAISAEATARATAVSDEATARAAAIAAEAAARSSAITAEATARTNAIAAETTARGDAITAEATTRAAGDVAALADAKAYADTQDATTLASAQAYADTAEADAISTSAAAIASGDAATLASAQSYADTAEADAVSTAAADAQSKANAAQAAAISHADTGDATTLASAQAYADQAEADAISTSAAAIASGDATTLASAQSYTDAQLSAVTSGQDWQDSVASLLFDASMLPGSPSSGDRYLIGNDESDAAKKNRLAIYDGSSWSFTAPETGWVISADDTGSTYRWGGTAPWTLIGNFTGACMKSAALGDIDPNAARSNLSLVPGTHVQAYHARLAGVANASVGMLAYEGFLAIDSGGNVSAVEQGDFRTDSIPVRGSRETLFPAAGGTVTASGYKHTFKVNMSNGGGAEFFLPAGIDGARCVVKVTSHCGDSNQLTIKPASGSGHTIDEGASHVFSNSLESQTFEFDSGNWDVI